MFLTTKKIIRCWKKWESTTYIGKEKSNTICESNQMSDLTEKGFKIVIINMFIDLKENLIKEVREDIMAMSHQIENINKVKEMI